MGVLSFALIVIILQPYININIYATLYTRCNTSDTYPRVYSAEPFFSNYCASLLEAATQCSSNYFCDLISRNDDQCSFHSVVKRSDSCFKDNSGNVSLAVFKPCDCLLTSDFWLGVGSFYLFVTPESYKCNQGQDVCMSLGGIMAEFYSIDELNLSLTLITGDVFVGGKLVDSRYVWPSTGHEIGDSLWVPDEPSHMAPCVQIWNRKSALDDTFLSQLRPILCQKRLH